MSICAKYRTFWYESQTKDGLVCLDHKLRDTIKTTKTKAYQNVNLWSSLVWFGSLRLNQRRMCFLNIEYIEAYRFVYPRFFSTNTIQSFRKFLYSKYLKHRSSQPNNQWNSHILSGHLTFPNIRISIVVVDNAKSERKEKVW